MPSIARTLGAVGVGAVLALGVTQSASAAEGQLIIGSTTYNNPSGCYMVGSLPKQVQNHTNGIAYIFSTNNCTGFVIQTLTPGTSAPDYYGYSVYVG
ncbi:hypothetical protein ACWCQS_19510 [Streptomyces sp. NPDC002076]